MGCVKVLCSKGAATSRVLQKSGAGQGKDKALLGRRLGKDGCAGNAATTCLCSWEMLRIHVKLPEFCCWRQSLPQHNLISEHLTVQPLNVLFAVVFLFFIFFQQGDSVKLMAKLLLLLAIRLQNKLLYKEMGNGNRGAFFPCLLLKQSAVFCRDERYPSENRHITSAFSGNTGGTLR